MRFDLSRGIVYPPAIADRLVCSRLAEITAAVRSVGVHDGRARPTRERRKAAVR